MVTTAYVKLWGRVIGAVAWDETTQMASFEYAGDFDPEVWPVAPIKMPFKRIYTFPELKNNPSFMGLPGMLADCLPDRYGQDLINAWLARHGRPANSLNPVELLCFTGTRGMGALEFEPALAPAANAQKLELESLIRYTQEILSRKKRQQVRTNAALRDVMLEVLKMGTSAGGARPKAIIAYNEKTGEIRSGQTLPGKDYGHWLIKFDGLLDTQFGKTHGYGRVEMAYYKMATECGIEMAECRLIEENGRAHFMTRRFDRINGDEKIHLQTLCGLLHFDYAQVTLYSYEQLFYTMRLLKLSYAEAEQMFRRMVFNVLARNCNDHTKNFSFVMDKAGKWKLAPAYDVCHAYHPDSYRVSKHCLSINGKRGDITCDDLLAVAEQNSIRRPMQIIEQCAATVADWMRFAKMYDVDKRLAIAIDKILLKHFGTWRKSKSMSKKKRTNKREPE
ncbi:MAG: type II toxin-antitoxin system HipA family toxin [Chitinophagales bacterium]|nr:type II toxin-antitoxin system HipA family toxin [Chitinophagales bacterium]MDW8418736.1 type II toxin-antitoxin system HipA family toxin [Chitinophagales bacterium]